MSADWVTAIATAGTFVVIAASAAAALVQLRHMRTGNQISAYNECRETMDSREFREALAFIRGELPERLKNQATVKQIAAEGLPGPPLALSVAKALGSILNIWRSWQPSFLNVTAPMAPIRPICAACRSTNRRYNER